LSVNYLSNSKLDSFNFAAFSTQNFSDWWTGVHERRPDRISTSYSSKDLNENSLFFSFHCDFVFAYVTSSKFPSSFSLINWIFSLISSSSNFFVLSNSNGLTSRQAIIVIALSRLTLSLSGFSNKFYSKRPTFIVCFSSLLFRNLTRRNATIIRVTFSFWVSAKISPKRGMTVYLQNKTTIELIHFESSHFTWT